jgi:hypothetical protein
MSGGSFNYAYQGTERFADELELKLEENPYEWELKTRNKLWEISTMSRYISMLMREAEWLYSGDTGDDSFMERVAEIEQWNPQEAFDMIASRKAS